MPRRAWRRIWQPRKAARQSGLVALRRGGRRSSAPAPAIRASCASARHRASCESASPAASASIRRADRHSGPTGSRSAPPWWRRLSSTTSRKRRASSATARSRAAMSEGPPVSSTSSSVIRIRRPRASISLQEGAQLALVHLVAEGREMPLHAQRIDRHAPLQQAVQQAQGAGAEAVIFGRALFKAPIVIDQPDLGDRRRAPHETPGRYSRARKRPARARAASRRRGLPRRAAPALH